ncbi:MAG: glycosyltransferase family 2 protein [Candidatus Delongbacteria bacterium]|nr:glycosyltransferase family 2 protein [Candidatus Delongbacteria bacterium]
MKISIIIPVYNGEDTLFRCLDAIRLIDYPVDDYEVIVVNDASTDRTFRIVTGYDIRVIGLRKRIGYVESLIVGAKNATYENLIFINQRTVIKKDLLKNICNIGYLPIIAGEVNIDKYRSNQDALLYILRSKLYNPHYPQKNFAEELWITKKNFKKIYKSTKLFGINKDMFLTISKEGFSIENSEEWIYKKIVYENKIKLLSHTKIDINYVSKLDKKPKKKIVNLGKEWADQNLSKFNLFSIFYYLIHIFILILVYLYTNYALGVLFSFYLIFLIYLSKSKKDFGIVLKTTPGAIVRFYIGTIKSITSKRKSS